ncbi:MAG: carbon monoxide dehydrogenase [Rubrivivax sp.]|nr:carbon monoxide dehydrogenase [Rubrivivax sp.]
MEIDFDKRYPVRASPEQAWAVLADLRATAGCWPGAAITAQHDSRRFDGTVSAPIGLLTTRFDGHVELLALDALRRELRLAAQGVDQGGSSASMQLTARIEDGETPAACVLVGRAGIALGGPLAQLDRRLLMSTSDALLGQFAERFRTAAAAMPAPTSALARGEASPALQSAGPDSTLTLMVQAGQAPGAAFAAKGAAGGAATSGTAAGSGAVRRAWAALCNALGGGGKT